MQPHCGEPQRTPPSAAQQHSREYRLIFGEDFEWVTEVRLAFVELLVTAIWVFLSLGATASVLWSCLDECGVNVDVAGVPLPAAPCFFPTVSIQVALTTGFAAAIAGVWH